MTREEAEKVIADIRAWRDLGTGDKEWWNYNHIVNCNAWNEGTECCLDDKADTKFLDWLRERLTNA